MTASSQPRRGGFGGAVIAGAHDGNPLRLLSDEAIFGLTRDSTYLFGMLRDADGRLWSVMRRRASAPSWPNRLWVRSSFGPAGLDRHDLPQRSATAARVMAAADRGSARFYADAADEDEPMTCTVGPDRVEWAEGSILQLSGSDVSQGLQWYLPDVDGSMLYASRLFAVDGHLLATPVRGIVGLEDVFLDPGRSNYVDDPITRHRLSTAWCSWATCYDDGTAESGHVAFGPGRFGFGMRSSADGALDIGAKVQGEVTLEDVAPVHATFEIDGQQWEFVVDPYGRCAPLGGPVRQAEGLFQRVGESRRPIVWSASLEVPA